MGNMVYKIVWYVLRQFYKLVYPNRVTGLEKLPAEGGYIICINHLSGHDPLLIATRLPRRRVMTFMAKKELFEVPVVGKMMYALKGIPVDRGNADIAAVRACMAALKEGYVLGIFPQGTRSKDNTPTPMLNGASMIALRGGVPVHPAYIDGPSKPFRRMNVRFGDAIDLSAFGRRCDSETLSAATALIAGSIWGLQEEKKQA